MARASFSLSAIENEAAGKPIASITVHYAVNYGGRSQEKPVVYTWDKRKQIKWQNVIRCRLDFDKPKSYLHNGDGCKRPGYRVKPK